MLRDIIVAIISVNTIVETRRWGILKGFVLHAAATLSPHVLIGNIKDMIRLITKDTPNPSKNIGKVKVPVEIIGNSTLNTMQRMKHIQRDMITVNLSNFIFSPEVDKFLEWRNKGVMNFQSVSSKNFCMDKFAKLSTYFRGRVLTGLLLFFN